MTDDDRGGPSAKEEQEEESQIRVSLLPAAGWSPSSYDPPLRVPSDPIAVPSSVRRGGLSAVVNHLLDRRVVASSSNDDEDDSKDDDRPPAVAFDFLVGDRLLRTSVEAAARREGLGTERAVEVRYLPAARTPRRAGESRTAPDWVSALSWCGDGGGLWAAFYDGTVRGYARDGARTVERVSARAHAGPVKCLATTTIDGGVLIASGSADHTLRTHASRDGTIVAHGVYDGGHSNAVEAVALCANQTNGTALMASGDWNGGLCLWRVPEVTDGDEGGDTTTTTTKGDRAKRRRREDDAVSSSSSSSAASPVAVAPVASWRAHAGNVSALLWGRGGGDGGDDPARLLSTSWDHSLRVWDVEREECLLTLNGSRVVSAAGRCVNSDVVATGHPDRTVRLWDARTGAGTEASTSSAADATLRPSHTAWVSDLRWSPTRPHVLATTSHDGTVKMWDVRSSLPLFTMRPQPKDHKSLCLAFAGDGDDAKTDAALFSGGTDARVHRYDL